MTRLAIMNQIELILYRKIVHRGKLHFILADVKLISNIHTKYNGEFKATAGSNNAISVHMSHRSRNIIHGR